MHDAPRRTLGFWGLLIFTYSCVGGGAAGSENLIGTGGLFVGLAGVLLFPCVWGLVTAAITAELALEYGRTNGGLYHWVEDLFCAPRTALNIAVWVLAMNSFTTVAASEFSVVYIATVTPIGTGYWATVGLSAAIVLAGLALNLCSIRAVNAACWAITANSLCAFGLLVAIAAARVARSGPRRNVAADQPPLASIDWGFLLNLLAFNCAGYEAVANVITTVKKKDTVPRAMAAAAALVTSVYIVSLTVPYLEDSQPHTAWRTGYFSTLALRLGGPGLQGWVVVACCLTNLQTFSVSLQGSAQLLATLADNGRAPAALARRAADGTPKAALLGAALLSALSLLLPLRASLGGTGILYALVVLAEVTACVGARHTMRFLPQRRFVRALCCAPPFALALVMLASQNVTLLLSSLGAVAGTACALLFVGRRQDSEAPPRAPKVELQI